MKYKQKKTNCILCYERRYNSSWTYQYFKIANSYGYVVLGILTNKATSEYKDTIAATFNHVENLFLNL